MQCDGKMGLTTPSVVSQPHPLRRYWLLVEPDAYLCRLLGKTTVTDVLRVLVAAQRSTVPFPSAPPFASASLPPDENSGVHAHPTTTRFEYLKNTNYFFVFSCVVLASAVTVRALCLQSFIMKAITPSKDGGVKTITSVPSGVDSNGIFMLDVSLLLCTSAPPKKKGTFIVT